MVRFCRQRGEAIAFLLAVCLGKIWAARLNLCQVFEIEVLEEGRTCV